MIFALSGAPPTAVGPLYAGQPVAAVRRALGPGTPAAACQPDPKLKPGDCPLELDYRDGKNVLKVGFSGAGAVVRTVEIDLGASQHGIALANVHPGAFSAWTWRGHPIDRLPATPIAGWSGTPEAAHADCLVRFTGPAQPGGAELVTSYGCAPGTSRVAVFMTGYVDP